MLQATRPWLSTRDIDRGALWFSEINDQLKDTSVGIVLLTQENRLRPWILFESGALAKGLSSNRVCTFLVDLQPSDLQDPLAQFNHTLPEKNSMWELVRTLNSCLALAALDERILQQVFSTYWGQFEQKFKQALKDNPPGDKPEPRHKDDILAEILDNTRVLHHRLRRMESVVERDERYLFESGGRRRLPASAAKELIRDMVASGAPPDLVIDRLTSMDVPKDWIMKRIEEAVLNGTNPSVEEKKQ